MSLTLSVKQSVRSALGRDVAMRQTFPISGSPLEVPRGNNMHAMLLGLLGGKLIRAVRKLSI